MSLLRHLRVRPRVSSPGWAENMGILCCQGGTCVRTATTRSMCICSGDPCTGLHHANTPKSLHPSTCSACKPLALAAVGPIASGNRVCQDLPSQRISLQPRPDPCAWRIQTADFLRSWASKQRGCAIGAEQCDCGTEVPGWNRTGEAVSASMEDIPPSQVGQAVCMGNPLRGPPSATARPQFWRAGFLEGEASNRCRTRNWVLLLRKESSTADELCSWVRQRGWGPSEGRLGTLRARRPSGPKTARHACRMSSDRADTALRKSAPRAQRPGSSFEALGDDDPVFATDDFRMFAMKVSAGPLPDRFDAIPCFLV